MTCLTDSLHCLVVQIGTTQKYSLVSNFNVGPNLLDWICDMSHGPLFVAFVYVRDLTDLSVQESYINRLLFYYVLLVCYDSSVSQI